ncbi:putative enterotoxin [Cordyceps sp. RAO-2017]|nr:putative enterotoxin [Cordyceps sp. RAO-2017]
MHLSASLCLLFSLGAGLGGADPAPDNGCDWTPKETWPLRTGAGAGPGPEFVFRGDSREPETIKAEGGWLPWARPELSGRAYGLLNHERDERDALGRRDSVYVSTTTSFDVAARYAALNVRRNAAGRTYIYYLHASPNLVDVNGALANETRFWWQREFAAMGGLRWSQVVGWVRVDAGFFAALGYRLPGCGAEDGANGLFHDRLERPCAAAGGDIASPDYYTGSPDPSTPSPGSYTASPDYSTASPDYSTASPDYYTASPDYCPVRWRSFRAAAWEPQLAGFADFEHEFAARGRPLWWRAVEPWRTALAKTTEQHALDFMDRTRNATGWRGRFPLFDRGDREPPCPEPVSCPVRSGPVESVPSSGAVRRSLL